MAKTTKAARSPVSTVTDLFGGASKTDTVFKVKASKGKDRSEEDLGPELDQLAAFRVLIDALSGTADQLQEQIKERCIGIYAEKATKSKKHPESFLGKGDVSQASIEMRKRATNHGVDADACKELQKAKVSLEKKILVHERYVFNTELLQNENVRQAVSEAFQSHPVLKIIADKLILKQEQEFQWITTEQTLSDAAKNLKKDDYERLIPYISSLAIGKFHLDGESIVSGGRGETKAITPKAKAMAISMLQKLGVLPAPAEIVEVEDSLAKMKKK